MLVTVGELLGVVDLGIAAAQHERGVGDTRPVAGPAGLGINGIWGAEHQVRPLCVPIVRLAAGAAEHADGLGTILLDDLPRGIRHQVGGLVPAAALPFVEPAVLPGALHGMDYAILMVDVLGKGQAARAQRALGDGMLGVALHLHHDAVLHMDLQSAPYGVAPRRRPCAGTEDRLLPLFPFPLSHRFLLTSCNRWQFGSAYAFST